MKGIPGSVIKINAEKRGVKVEDLYQHMMDEKYDFDLLYNKPRFKGGPVSVKIVTNIYRTVGPFQVIEG